MQQLLKDICLVVESCGRKTVCVTDVVFALNRMGRTIYVSLSQPPREPTADTLQGFGEGVR